MKLTGFFTGEKQTVDVAGKGPVSVAQNTGQLERQIRSLVPGQTIQGELVAKNGNEIQIKLSDDTIIKARMEQNMNLEIGKTITFEVKNNGQSLLLSPLYANVATDANVLKALEMASLPINENTIEMTELLMKAGQSIDRNSLQQIFRECNMFADADMADIVDLHKLSMPVNESNLSQIVSYKNLTHQLITGLNQCFDTIPDMVQNLLQNGEFGSAQKLYQELLNMIPGNNPALIQTADGQLYVLQSATDGQAQIYSLPGDAKLLQTLLQPEYSELLQNLSGEENKQLLQALFHGDNNQLQQLLTGKENSPLLQALTDGEVQLLQTFLKGNEVTGKNPLLQMLTQDNIQQALSELLQKSAEQGTQLNTLSDFLNSNLQKLWTMTPEMVGDAEQVEQFYNRLDRQLKGLTHILESVQQTGSEAYRVTTNLTQNLDFLQQLNQAYTFVQLPLRLQQGNNAHGELFVYTNKKNLAAKDGQISALLHLDMENLGPVDVYVTMQNEKVNTKFYLQDDDMLDFLAEHMDILTERLKARGYSCSYEMMTREEGDKTEQSGIHQILQANGHVPVVQYAFDVRT